MVVVVVVFPSIFSFSSSFDAVCAHKCREEKFFFRKHCRIANAVYGLLIFSIHVQRQFLSLRWLMLNELEEPFFSRDIHSNHLQVLFLNPPPYFLHQDFLLLSRVLVILVFLHPRIYALAICRW